MVEFDSILMDIMSKFPDTILEKEVLMVIKTYMTRQLPLRFMDKKMPAISPESHTDFKVDEKDMLILEELLKDCRESSYKIASKASLSADGIGYRIKKLVEMGVIKQFTILANLSYLKYDWYTFAINVKKFDKEAEGKFLEFCQNHPFIIKAERTLGTWDFLLYIATDSPRNFHQTIKEIKMTFADIIKNYTAYNAYIEHYYTSLPRVIIDSYIKPKK
jgi:DNA-binding Lrp family transcriptional regulator